MTTNYGSIGCDGADEDMAALLCPMCAEDADDRYEDYPTPFIGWMVDVLLFPALTAMGIAVALMIASSSMWVTIKCWTDIVGHLR